MQRRCAPSGTHLRSAATRALSCLRKGTRAEPDLGREVRPVRDVRFRAVNHERREAHRSHTEPGDSHRGLKGWIATCKRSGSERGIGTAEPCASRRCRGSRPGKVRAPPRRVLAPQQRRCPTASAPRCSRALDSPCDLHSNPTLTVSWGRADPQELRRAAGPATRRPRHLVELAVHGTGANLCNEHPGAGQVSAQRFIAAAVRIFGREVLAAGKDSPAASDPAAR